MEKTYHSHYREKDQQYQLNVNHQINVARLAENYCPLPELKKTAWLTGIHHDDGKYPEEWQEYFEKSLKEEGCNEGKLDHSTLGGLVVNQYLSGTLLGEMVQDAIYMHHGLQDCVSISDGSILLEKRKQKYTAEKVKAVCREAEVLLEASELKLNAAEMAEIRKKARADLNVLAKEVQLFAKNNNGLYGNRNFYLGMLERLLFSSLMDADWRDTADFMENRKTDTGMSQDEIQKVWEYGIITLENKLNELDKTSEIASCRQDISARCRNAAYASGNLFRLSVPTGAGKTLSTLRFALHCAKANKKRHIFYVAPFKSILEQNASVIRTSLDMPDMILEHHSDVVQEEVKGQQRYERLIENWDEVPVIVTTAVQFFQTLFKEKRSSIRRFHSLCDSVIIFDEVQAMPVKLLQLFNLAVNFLTQFCNTTIVLCTATQPLLDRLPENRMLPPVDMVNSISAYKEVFRRVEFHDCTQDCGKGFNISQAVDFILEKSRQMDQVLMICNTKSCALDIYEQRKGKTEGGLSHLSTLMCAEHRSNVLKEIRERFDRNEKVICISTQLVEAGVDFSFQCVIRSLAGLDNLIQAAGRCNRNGGPEKGLVCLIKMSEEAERISSLKDIRTAQEAMLCTLQAYRKSPESFGERLDSEEAVTLYFKYYLMEHKDETSYPVLKEWGRSSLVELLSDNKIFAAEKKEIRLKQAFLSAGQIFTVIDDKGLKNILVPYREGKGLIQALQSEADPEQKRIILRKLQRYSVGVSEKTLKNLGNEVYRIEEYRVLVMAEGYYDENVGLKEEPSALDFLNF